MSLSKETELGTISISKIMAAQVLVDAIKQSGCALKVWPATKKGRQIGTDTKYNISDISSHIAAEMDENNNGVLVINFCIILKYGCSIKEMTKKLSDFIANEFKKLCSDDAIEKYIVRVTVTGVKSKQIAKRNIEVTNEYES